MSLITHADLGDLSYSNWRGDKHISFTVMVTAYAVEDRQPIFLSLVGPQEALGAIRGALALGESMSLRCYPHSWYLQTKRKMIKKVSWTKLETASSENLILAHEILNSETLTDPAYMTVSATTPEGIRNEVMERVYLYVPIPNFPAWKPILWLMAKGAGLISELTETAGIRIWKVSTDTEKWSALVATAIKENAITSLHDLQELANASA